MTALVGWLRFARHWFVGHRAVLSGGTMFAAASCETCGRRWNWER